MKKANDMKRSATYPVRKWVRRTAMVILTSFVCQIMWPTLSWALTSGPQQPEASNFTPADVSQLVDPFTGDLSYNIPILDIGGYPINLSYNSGITMDQEATWVGLGWNLNTGAITRDVRGLPDDFWGEEIVRTFNTKPNITAGGSVTVGAEFAGFPLNAAYGLQVKYNNYSGFSVGQTVKGGLKLGDNVNIGLGLSTTNGGLDINPNISFGSKWQGADKTNYKGSLGFGLNINSRTGLSQMSLNASVTAGSKEQATNHKRESSKYSVGAGGGGSISFLNPTHTPQNTLPYENFNFSGSFKIGGAVVFGDISGTIQGFYSEQTLMTNTVRNPAYGYIYSEKGQSMDNAAHDFNREKDGPFTNNTPTLPLTNHTYDAFNIKAQGIGGSFRAFRNDAGHLYDPSMYNPSGGGAFGLEVDLGNAVDFGVDINVNWNESRSGKWENMNAAKNQLKFTQPAMNSLYENVFFKLVGEKTSETDNSYLASIQHDKPVAIKLQNANLPMATNQLESDNSVTQLTGDNRRDQRLIRNTSVQCFTVADVKRAFPIYARYLPAVAKDHHIAMIVVTSADGTRYVFGLPAYNKVKKEVSFAVGQNMQGAPGNAKDPSTNLVSYNPADASTGNQKGIDNYYDLTETPAFVHTWYLTEVLSPDYSDLTGDGPTPDDLGGYVMFKYGVENTNGSISPNISNYKWRTPSTGNGMTASYNEGLKTILTDDKGTYLYGEKDIWYPSSVESKTQFVTFEYDSRQDGYGVTGEHGNIGGSPQQNISKIKIYSRQDYLNNSTSAVPLKTVHFDYDYSLCDGVYNNINGGGKLTLRKVFFTYRDSEKARYNAYEFEYPTGTNESDPDFGNPGYNPSHTDRWGYYRNNTNSYGIPRNEDYPYTYQDKTTADKLARCWNLKAIQLPTGGRITFEYESDDYAYVQDRKACRMFQVLGAGNSPSAYTDKLFLPSGSYASNNYIFFRLEDDLTGMSPTDADRIVKEKYFADPDEPEQNGPTKYLYFRFLTNVNNGNEAPAYEYVSGYADVSNGQYCGVHTGDYSIGWVKLKELQPDGAGTGMYNQISKAGWAFSRINTPFYANNQPVPGQSDPGDFLRAILNASIINQLVQFFKGPNNKLRSQGFSNRFVPEKSWIRLYDPDGFKYGGGHRIKSVKISDNWEAMESTEESFEYGQEYEYTTADGTKSSGVASFEPMYGADENPFRIPVFYNKEYGPLIPDDRFYQEEPFGESLFPSPGIGYSYVKIMNLQRNGVTKTATGHMVKEFYTAKDFPTKTTRTKLNVRRAKIDPLLAIFSPYTFDFLTGSQGFCIELNDMHGKPKREAVYQEGNTAEPISYTNYFYKLETSNQSEISNQVAVLENNGQVFVKELGTEIDIVADFRESRNMGGNIDIGFNTDYTQFGPFPLIILAVFPKLKMEDTQFRSASVTKVVNRYGIPVRTEVYSDESIISSQNRLFNGVSGEPLSTQVNNEYEDDRYTLSVPAYWTYDGMGHASINNGFTMLSTVSPTPNNNFERSTGRITMPSAGSFFKPGDEVVWFNYSPGRIVGTNNNSPSNHRYRLWVSQKSNGDLYFIRADGQPFITSGQQDIAFKVIRSGRRNILEPKIAEFATLEPPVTGFTSGIVDITNATKVLSVTGQTFNEQWKTIRRYQECDTETLCVCEELPWATAYLNMIAYNISANATFHYGELNVYDNTGYHNGFTSALFAHFWPDMLTGSPNNCPMAQITEVNIFSSPHDDVPIWNPATDPFFLGGGNMELQLVFTGITEDNYTSKCPACIRYYVSLHDPADVPASYYNPNCTINTQTQTMYLPITINGEQKVLKFGPFTGNPSASCGAIRDCETITLPSPDNSPGQVVNPYILNILGRWRPYENYTLIEDRYISTNVSGEVQPNLRTDGYIDGYTPFWYLSDDYWTYAGYDDVHWKRTTTMTHYHPSGPQIEEKNALDIYSAALYGYHEQLVIAAANNAQFKDVGFDGFEDYDHLDASNSNAGCKISHFRFDANAGDVVNTHAHTGKRSLKVSGATTMQRALQSATVFRNTRDVPYELEAGDLTEFFGPASGFGVEQKFIFSFWVKDDNYTPVIFDYANISGDIKLNATSIVTGTVKKSPVIINGWQKFEYEFTIPASSSGTLTVELSTSSGTAYFDDVRIHPFNSNMKSYVYDPLDLRFMAELDENNYATFYEYDEDGALVRTKKETERGIMTIQENRYGNYKQ